MVCLRQTAAGKVFTYSQNLFRVSRPRLDRATDEKRLLLPLVGRDMCLAIVYPSCITSHLYDYLAPVLMLLLKTWTIFIRVFLVFIYLWA